MKLTLMIEQPPDADPRTQELDTSQRGWVTVLDEHGTPLLRISTDPASQTVGVGFYGSLGDFLYWFTLTPTQPGGMWQTHLEP